MDNLSNLRFCKGSLVRLKLGRAFRPGKRRVARIEMFYSDIKGGVRLDTPLAGFYSWNVEDLERVREAKVRAKLQKPESK